MCFFFPSSKYNAEAHKVDTDIRSTSSAFKKKKKKKKSDATSKQAEPISLPAFTDYKYVKLSLKSRCSFFFFFFSPSLQDVTVARAGCEHPFSSLLCHAGSLSEWLSVKVPSPAESSWPWTSQTGNTGLMLGAWCSTSCWVLQTCCRSSLFEDSRDTVEPWHREKRCRPI